MMSVELGGNTESRSIYSEDTVSLSLDQLGNLNWLYKASTQSGAGMDMQSSLSLEAVDGTWKLLLA